MDWSDIGIMMKNVFHWVFHTCCYGKSMHMGFGKACVPIPEVSIKGGQNIMLESGAIGFGVRNSLNIHVCIWVFPKIVGFPPKSSILIGFSIINHPFWGKIFLETSICLHWKCRIHGQTGNFLQWGPGSLQVAHQVEDRQCFGITIRQYETYMFGWKHTVSTWMSNFGVLWPSETYCMDPPRNFHYKMLGVGVSIKLFLNRTQMFLFEGLTFYRELWFDMVWYFIVIQLCSA